VVLDGGGGGFGGDGGGGGGYGGGDVVVVVPVVAFFIYLVLLVVTCHYVFVLYSYNYLLHEPYFMSIGLFLNYNLLVHYCHALVHALSFGVQI